MLLSCLIIVSLNETNKDRIPHLDEPQFLNILIFAGYKSNYLREAKIKTSTNTTKRNGKTEIKRSLIADKHIERSDQKQLFFFCPTENFWQPGHSLMPQSHLLRIWVQRLADEWIPKNLLGAAGTGQLHAGVPARFTCWEGIWDSFETSDLIKNSFQFCSQSLRRIYLL